MKKLVICVLLGLFCGPGRVMAQDIAIKTNLLYWASTTPNLALEVKLGDRTTFELTGGYNPWTLKKDTNSKIKHWAVVPEFRYWLCEPHNGHFFGVQSGYGFYNVAGFRIPFYSETTRNHRYQGWATGLGLTYGYSWILGKRLNLEASVGLGYVYTRFDRYECATCGKFLGANHENYFGPTELAITLVYMIK